MEHIKVKSKFIKSNNYPTLGSFVLVETDLILSKIKEFLPNLETFPFYNNLGFNNQNYEKNKYLVCKILNSKLDVNKKTIFEIESLNIVIKPSINRITLEIFDTEIFAKLEDIEYINQETNLPVKFINDKDFMGLVEISMDYGDPEEFDYSIKSTLLENTKDESSFERVAFKVEKPNPLKEMVESLGIMPNPKQLDPWSLYKQPKQELKHKYSSFDNDQNCMIDIETLGTAVDCVISEISLVKFNAKTGEILKKFKVNIDVQTSLNEGFSVTKSTLSFWCDQDKVLLDKVIFSGHKSVKLAMHDVMVWLTENFDISKLQLWGNGPTFDISKLEYHFNKFGIEKMWKYYNERCVRTIKAIDPNLAKSITFTGDKHDSLADCEHQIKQISTIIKKYDL